MSTKDYEMSDDDMTEVVPVQRSKYARGEQEGSEGGGAAGAADAKETPRH